MNTKGNNEDPSVSADLCWWWLGNASNWKISKNTHLNLPLWDSHTNCLQSFLQNVNGWVINEYTTNLINWVIQLSLICWINTQLCSFVCTDFRETDQELDSFYTQSHIFRSSKLIRQPIDRQFQVRPLSSFQTNKVNMMFELDSKCWV